MLGRLPPLRLSHQESRIQYGDILVQRADEMLASGNREKIELAANCYHNLVAYIPEHAGVNEAKKYLQSVGKLEAAEAAAKKEAKERPVRERRIKTIWDASGETLLTDDRKPGCWSSL